MKNLVIVFIMAFILFGCQEKEIGQNLLIIDEIPTWKKNLLVSGFIDINDARGYLKDYKDFLDKEVKVKGRDGKDSTIKIKDIILPAWDGCIDCDKDSRVSFSLSKKAVDSLFNQKGAENLLIYPGINKKKVFTTVLVAADGNYKPIIRSTTTSATQDPVNGYMVYDEIRPCPPPRGCQSF